MLQRMAHFLVFVYLGPMYAQGPAPVRPFYLEGRQYLKPVDGSGPLAEHHRIVVARRVDGTRVRIEIGNPVDPNWSVRQVIFNDDSSVFLYDDYKMKSTWGPDKSVTHVDWDPDCNRRPTGDQHLTFDQMLRQEVLESDHVYDNGSKRAVRNQAVTLGCENLYSRSEARQADGSFAVTAEFKLTTLRLGDPDDRLFDTGLSFEEVPPSKPLALMIAKIKQRIPDGDLDGIKQVSEAQDRRYFESKSGQAKQ
jgi:hypothetical protein